MIKTGRFYVKATALKDADFRALDYVTSLVRHKEYENATSKKSYEDGKKALESAHADIDVLTCDVSIINDTLKEDAGQFIKDRAEVNALKKELENVLPLEKITALSRTDYVHVVLMAYPIYKRVSLSVDLFDPEKGGIDISKAIRAYYSNKKMKDLKDNLRAIFNKILGTDGDYFYGIKLSRSDFDDSDILHFLANFGGATTRDSKKKGDTISFGDFHYVDNSGNKKKTADAFTALCAVVVDNAKKHAIIKPENKPEETENKSEETENK